MTVPFLTHAKFLALLNQNGWIVVSSDYWDKYNRVIMQKDGHNFPLQYAEVYYFPFVVRTCKSLGIEPPADHLKYFEQYEEYKKRNKE